MYLNIEINILD